jgi:DNA-binding IclR family transcriptional regulator
MAGQTASAGATVTSRALSVLGAFDAEHRALTLTELARRAGLPVPTAHRILADLARWGAVQRRPGG